MNALKFTLAIGVLAVSTQAADFFPLKDGNIWKYRNAATGAQFTVRVTTPTWINDKVYYGLQEYTPAPVLVRREEHGQLVQVDRETGVERLLTSFEPFDRGYWIANSRECPEQLGKTNEKRGTHDGPAGPINDVLEVNYLLVLCADVGTDTEQYAENIGMVRRVVTSIAGPQKFDLVYARVGSTEINAQLNARFSVTVSTDGAGQLTAILHVSLASQPLKLQFPTSQEYDVELRDESGNTLWKWSDGAVFLAALHDRVVSGDLFFSVPVPTSFLPIGPSPQTLTLQAWLTTLGAVPQFSATVPITL